ncbi:hypothetical protein SLA2020_525470 [Shorea laevis]
MDEQKPNKPNAPRKMRFAPKAPPRRGTPKVEVKPEKVEDADDVQAKDLLQRFNQASLRSRPKVEKKVAASQVAFGYGGGSTTIKSYGVPRGAFGSSRDQGDPNSLGLREEKEYKEPWDYYSYYPVTLPMRRPYSGNPELLNEEEFGETSETRILDENSRNPAEELGLLEEKLEPTMFFIQLPLTVPMVKKSESVEEHKVDGSSKPAAREPTKGKPSGLDELPPGLMGKMLVYKSGAVKLKLGDTLFDVSPGLNSVFAQDVAAINTTEGHCCVVGELNKRVVLTPDVDSILDSMNDL